MSKLYKRLLSLIFAAALLTSCLGITVLAADKKEPAPLILHYTDVPLYENGQYLGSGIMMDAVIYVPLLSFTEYMLQDVCDVVWHQESSTATLSSDALTITLTTDDAYMVANDRYLYLAEGAYNINGTIVVPISALARIFHLGLDLDEAAWELQIDNSEFEILAPGSEYYDESDLYWLSHVIYSEAGNQPLEGMIGVGNVVLNRVNDSTGLFRDTIYDVIFQPGQFDVVSAGTLYLTPTDEALIAAKLCLEGYNTVGDSKWFVNPYYGNASWFYHNTTYELNIADHLFFS